MCLNFSQWRIFYDANMCVKQGNIGMSINMTLMVFALLRAVSMLMVDIANMCLMMSSDEMESLANTVLRSSAVLRWGLQGVFT